MKTYKKTINVPRLVIEHDRDAMSPREDDGNLGYFFTAEGRYKSPDGNTHPLYQIMQETAPDAKSTDDHIALMTKCAEAAFKASAPKDGSSHDEDLHIIDIYPVYRYEHGGVAYRRGTAGGFDYSNCGFYFITAKSISGTTQTDDSIRKGIDDELEEYTSWANGSVYRFTLYDEHGEEIDSCGGYYDIEDMREALPEEWKDERLESYQAE